MKQKFNSILQKTRFGIGIVLFGTILGISLQFTRAWVEPQGPPPTQNVGAPVNVGPNLQIKSGSFGVGSSAIGGSPHFLLTTSGSASGIGVTQHSIFPYDGNSGSKGAMYIGSGRSASKSGDNRNDIILYNYSCSGGTCNVPKIGLYADATFMNGLVGIGVSNPTEKLDVSGNVRANDFYISKIGKWASELGGSTVVNNPPPPPATTVYCGGVAYDPSAAYCQGGVLYRPGDWVPVLSHSYQQNDPDGNWANMQTKQAVFNVKTCKIKATTHFDNGGFLALFRGSAREGYWQLGMGNEGTVVTSAKNQSNNTGSPCNATQATVYCSNDGNDPTPCGTETQYTTRLPHINSGVKWCGTVPWAPFGAASATEYNVSYPKGTTADVYSTHGIGNGPDAHSYTIYGQYCN